MYPTDVDVLTRADWHTGKLGNLLGNFPVLSPKGSEEKEFTKGKIHIKLIQDYRIYGPNMAGWQKARHLTTVFTTRCSAIAERPRCRVRYSFRQK